MLLHLGALIPALVTGLVRAGCEQSIGAAPLWAPTAHGRAGFGVGPSPWCLSVMGNSPRGASKLRPGWLCTCSDNQDLPISSCASDVPRGWVKGKSPHFAVLHSPALPGSQQGHPDSTCVPGCSIAPCPSLVPPSCFPGSPGQPDVWRQSKHTWAGSPEGLALVLCHRGLFRATLDTVSHGGVVGGLGLPPHGSSPCAGHEMAQ